MDKQLIDKFQQLDEMHQDAPIEMKQNRGREFETLINEVMVKEGVLLNKSYHTRDNKAEQIDGAIKILERVFLLEVKWVESGIAASDLYAFIGKVENKFIGTLGLFISRNQLKENFVNALNKGRRQSIILLHGDDLNILFQGEIKFKDFLEFAILRMSYDNISYLPVEHYRQMMQAKKEIAVEVEKELDIKTFFTNILFNTAVDNEEMMLQTAKWSQGQKEKLFEFLINNYPKIWYQSLTGLRLQKLSYLIDILKSDIVNDLFMKRLADNYFLNLAQINPLQYLKDFFIELFAKFYKDITTVSKQSFSNFLVKRSFDIKGNWDEENRLTEIVNSLWDDLDQSTKEKLYEFYLDIYVSSERKEKFAQKSFSNKLVSKEMIPDAIIRDWFRKILVESKDAYDGPITDDRILTIASSYYKVAGLLKIELKNFPNYIKENIEKVIV